MSNTNETKENKFLNEQLENLEKKFDKKLDDIKKELQENSAENLLVEIDNEIVDAVQDLSNSIGGISSTVSQHTSNITSLQTGKQDKMTFDNTPTQTSTNPVTSDGVYSALATKQNTLTAGSNISIAGNTISATDTTYTAGENITIQNGVISATATDTTSLQNQITSHGTDIYNLQLQASANTSNIVSLQNGKQNKLTAGTGIAISEQNVISATGGVLTDVTASDVDSESATTGQVLTADGNGGASWQTASGGDGMTQEQQTKLDLVYQDYLSRTTLSDPNYSPQTFSDYPVGTILQGYAKYDRKFMLSFTNIITTPVFVFSAENNSVGNLSIRINFTSSVSSSLNTQISVFNNETSLFTENITLTSLNTNYLYEKTLSGLTLADGNVFYITITTNTVSNILTRVIAELVAPNAEVINQISPFAIDYYNGKYYISDCSSGTAKIAEINVSDMTNMNSLTWTDTGIECYQYRTSFNFQNINGVYTPNDRIDYYTTLDYVTYFKNRTTNDILSKSNCEMPDWVAYWNMSDVNYLTGYHPYSITQKININQGFTTLGYTTYSSKPKVYCATTSKFLPEQTTAFYSIFGNFVLPNLTIQASSITNVSNQEVSIGKGTRIHSYFNSQKATKPSFFVYAKLYDKIIRYEYLFSNNTATFTFNSATEIGAYEEYFEGANNDYFVVKNGELQYYKKPTE